MQWTKETDVVVVGTGGAAMAAAISAADRGLDVTMIESTDRWGGSTSMSGGGMWMPNNRLMQRDGAGDSREEAIAYMHASVQQAGNPGKGYTPERVEAYVDNVNSFIDLTERHGARYARAKEYPDYYPEMTGGKIGRAIESVPVDRKAIGDAWGTSRAESDGAPIPMMTDDVWLLARAWSTVSGFKRGAEFVFRALGGAVRGRADVGIGAGLAVTFYKIIDKLGVDLMLSTPLTDLIEEDGRIVGVKAGEGAKEITIRARKGVFIGSGGFGQNTELRKELQGVDNHSSANPGNLGAPIFIAQDHGAEVDLMDDAWWGGSLPAPTAEHSPSFLVSERSMPYSIIVNSAGKRFANESESYVDLGHHMIEDQKTTPGKFWMVLDKRHYRRYLRTFAIMPGLNKAQKEAGTKVEADTLEELARKMNVDVEGFRATVSAWNAACQTGRDEEFKRGDSSYDRYYGDPLVQPNPNMGPIAKGPFMAYEVVIGDLGTKGGIVTDEHARALRADGSVIDGLFAGGNASASVMGRTYPGPGSTIGPAVVFGYLAGQHMAGN